jgi:hypothetical protein
MNERTRPQINKANAQYSTGPRTEAGKLRSSLNALRHGLTGQLVVMPNEDLEAYQSHLKSFTDQYHPQDPTEANLVQALADSSWRLNRVAVLETNLLMLAVATTPSPLDLADAPLAVHDALSIAAAMESQAKALASLSIHSQRLSRQFQNALTQLRELQQIRRTQEEADLRELVNILEMCESQGQIYQPSDHGFVFSKEQIDVARRLHHRRKWATKAAHHHQTAA